MKKRLSLQDKAFKALKEAVREVVKRHAETGRPLAIWKNGKVVHVSAKQLLRKNGK
ncbi:MAG: hypothetical protein KJ902_02775 [Candidatus Omnitrophica bacterium]|nr:hypothetical protein [Candidatus Omnitrophota bacterium]MBU4457646.1 hypothetical protein [Candidatus Omnitrophota bacterium]